MIDTFRKATEEALTAVHEEMMVRKTGEVFLLFAMGSQFDHLIKQMLAEIGVFCLVADPASVTRADVQTLRPTGIILSGGPASVHAEPPPFDTTIFDLRIPVLGICLGFQMWAHDAGFRVEAAEAREFSIHKFRKTVASRLFDYFPDEFPVLQSHGDRVIGDTGLQVLGRTEHSPIAAARHGHLWGVQFHPEVSDTHNGRQLFENFCFGICHAKDRFPAEDVAGQKIKALRERIGDRRVLLALSGGSDSSVVAHLLKEAVSRQAGQIYAVYIQGLDRPDDRAYVEKYFGNEPWLNLEIIDATDQFLTALKGHETMAKKRLAMKGVYRKILIDAAERIGATFMAQGTLYTDISESGGGYQSGARKAVIKVHHNTGNDFPIPELTPLDDTVKDGARNIGRSIGVPEDLLVRHPFPGPGLAIRIEGEVTRERLRVESLVDGIYIEELRRWNLYSTVWQAGGVVTKSEITYTKGDDAGMGAVVALWAVWSVNGFTARAADLPTDFLRHVSRRITNEVREVGSVVYRYSDKPPSTIEWG